MKIIWTDFQIFVINFNNLFIKEKKILSSAVT